MPFKANPQPPTARRFTRADLARHDGSNPTLPMLIAYEGKVYDVSRSLPWSGGNHWGDHRAGQDLTGAIDTTYHGPELLRLVPCIGELEA